MAMGRPVIATRHGGIAELVVDGETGILCEENDIDSLAEGVRRLLAMQPAWPQMLTQARRAVEDTYALSRTTDALIEVYQSALTPPASNPDDTIRFSKEAA
jgi:colanic acid/amylovoran biosynthesis glycosyltransferase